MGFRGRQMAIAMQQQMRAIVGERPHELRGIDPLPPGAVRLRVISESNDYVTCRLADDTGGTGETFKVAKPRELQRSAFDGVTIDGWLYTYSSTTSRTLSKAGESDITETLRPPYIDPDGTPHIFEIAAVLSQQGGTGVTDCDWQDLNLAGRCWHRPTDVSTYELGEWRLKKFTSVATTTWTVPSGVSEIEVILVGGGGGGGTGTDIYSPGGMMPDYSGEGGAGGGGGGSLWAFAQVTAGDQFDVTVGDGGSGGSHSSSEATDGDDSTFVSKVGASLSLSLTAGGGEHADSDWVTGSIKSGKGGTWGGTVDGSSAFLGDGSSQKCVAFGHFGGDGHHGQAAQVIGTSGNDPSQGGNGGGTILAGGFGDNSSGSVDSSQYGVGGHGGQGGYSSSPANGEDGQSGACLILYRQTT